MLKRIVAILLLIMILPSCIAFSEDDYEEIIIPDEVPRGENGENQFLVPIAFKDNNLPKPMGPVYDDKTPKDFNKNSPALYTAKMTEYTSGYPTPTIYGDRTFRTGKGSSKCEVLHLDPMWAIVRYKGKIAYVKRHRIYDVEAIDPVNTPPYGVMKPQYIATTASTAEVHVSMTHEDICWVILKPGTKIAVHKIVDGWAVVIYMRSYAYIDVRDLTDLIAVSPTDTPLNDDSPIAAYTSFYKMNDTEKNHNRIHNIALGASRMSVVLQPGESFNANKQMGPYEESVGYLVAGALADGESIEGAGGGTCQVSSTIYNALLQLPGVQIVKRRAHGENGAPYLPHGVDAAVGNDSLNRLEGNTTGDGALTWLIYRADIEEAR